MSVCQYEFVYGLAVRNIVSGLVRDFFGISQTGDHSNLLWISRLTPPEESWCKHNSHGVYTHFHQVLLD